MKNEKVIQRDIADYIKQKTGLKILEEEFKDLGSIFKEHRFLLVSEYKDYFKGLKYHIEKLNSDLYSKYEHLSKECITEAIYNSFIEKYDRYNHINIYKLVFHTLSQSSDRMVKLKNSKGEEKEESYNVISYNDVNKNEFTIIKEKRINTAGSYQLPDFAIYINGIPLYTIEVKTSEAGLSKALLDYREKESYKKFIGCIGTDGIKAFISFMPTASYYYNWQAYGENKNNNNKNELEDLLSDLFFNKENAMFYLLYSVSVENDITGELLVNHRCQQFYTLLKLDRLFKNAITNNSKSFRKVIKHVQRSGKSITIKSTVNLLSRKYPKLFNKIYISVPDTVISKGIEQTFGSLKLSTGKQIKKIENREEYNKSIDYDSKNLEVYLMNIQKVDIEKNKLKKYIKDDVLIIIDEVHTHQTGKSAEIRKENFPNASILTFTATPRMVKYRNEVRNITKEIYSDDNQYLDEFKASDALNLGIVLPIVYEKAKYKQIWEETEVVKFDLTQQSIIKKYMEESKDIKEKINKEIEDQISILNEKLEKNQIDYYTYETKIKEIEEKVLKREEAKLSKLANDKTLRDIKENCIDSKINFIINDIHKKRKEVYANPDGSLSFKTKSFWVVEDVKMACAIIKKVSDLSPDNELNKINGVRFAVDYSEGRIQSNDGLFDENSEEQKNLKELNKKIVYGNHIIDDFDSEIEDSVDVLIIVGKYLMGYDQKKLVTVYLDTTINEPARLYQLITRPATAMKNKKNGYVCDLTWTETNFETFKTALTYYDRIDNKEEIEFVLTDELISQEIFKIKDSLHNISKMFKLESIKDINLKNKAEIYRNLISLSEKEQQIYFNEFNKILKSIKFLIAPEYYIDNMSEIYILMIINEDYYNSILNKLQEVVYDKTIITKIILDSYKIMNINSIKDIIDYKLEKISSRNNIFLEENEDEKQCRKIYEIKFKVYRNKNFVSKTLWEKMINMLEELKKTSIQDEKCNNIYNDLSKLSINALNETEIEIRDKFNNNFCHYLAYHNMKECIKNILDINDKMEYILKEYTRKLSEDFYIEFSNSTDLNCYEITTEIVRDFAKEHENWLKSADLKEENKSERKDFYLKFRKQDKIYYNCLIEIAESIRDRLVNDKGLIPYYE